MHEPSAKTQTRRRPYLDKTIQQSLIVVRLVVKLIPVTCLIHNEATHTTKKQHLITDVAFFYIYPKKSSKCKSRATIILSIVLCSKSFMPETISLSRLIERSTFLASSNKVMSFRARMFKSLSL